ncbi:hypothetical protein RMHFA_05616 (plasmid) [Roseomonas mucosa]|nr:hypothetical protein RMHFA_05616 [Roseomonas mucosa]
MFIPLPISTLARRYGRHWLHSSRPRATRARMLPQGAKLSWWHHQLDGQLPSCVASGDCSKVSESGLRCSGYLRHMDGACGNTADDDGCK